MSDHDEDTVWINECTRRFHLRTGFYPDCKEVIRQIRLYRRDCLLPSRKEWTKYEIKKRALHRFAMTEAIKRIAERTDEDPIRILYAFKSEVDDMIASSECSTTWTFCGEIWNAIEDLMAYLS